MTIDKTIQSIHQMAITTKSVVNIMYTSRMVEEFILKVLRPYGLSIQQYNVLRILRGQNQKPANLCTIQERMIDRSSNTSRLIDKLILKKLVSRQICDNNRRKIEVLITNKGLSLLEELDPIIEENNENILINLSHTELETLNTLLDTLRSEKNI